MKLTKPIIILSAIIVVFVTTALFSLLVPLFNSSGECNDIYIGTVYKSFSHTVCTSFLSFQIPEYWAIGQATIIPMSLLFGIFCAALLTLFLLIKMQNQSSKT